MAKQVRGAAGFQVLKVLQGSLPAFSSKRMGNSWNIEGIHGNGLKWWSVVQPLIFCGDYPQLLLHSAGCCGCLLMIWWCLSIFCLSLYILAHSGPCLKNPLVMLPSACKWQLSTQNLGNSKNLHHFLIILMCNLYFLRLGHRSQPCHRSSRVTFQVAMRRVVRLRSGLLALGLQFAVPKIRSFAVCESSKEQSLEQFLKSNKAFGFGDVLFRIEWLLSFAEAWVLPCDVCLHTLFTNQSLKTRLGSWMFIANPTFRCFLSCLQAQKWIELNSDKSKSCAFDSTNSKTLVVK